MTGGMFGDSSGMLRGKSAKGGSFGERCRYGMLSFTASGWNVYFNV